jgi:hypothetical protein
MMQDEVEAQMANTDTRMVRLVEGFLPYVIIINAWTLGERVRDGRCVRPSAETQET